jgi:hypothetical protein
MGTIICAYCRKPLERLNSVESEVREDVQEKTEYMCTNTGCEFGSRVIHESKRPLRKQGYITVYMLQKQPEPKSRLRRLFGEMAGQFSIW